MRLVIGGVLQTTPALELTGAGETESTPPETGFLGIALHPEFDSNGYVYLYWTASGEGSGDDGMFGQDTDEEFALPDLGNRVDRFVWDGTALTWDMNIVALRSNTLDTDTLDRILPAEPASG